MTFYESLQSLISEKQAVIVAVKARIAEHSELADSGAKKTRDSEIRHIRQWVAKLLQAQNDLQRLLMLAEKHKPQPEKKKIMDFFHRPPAKSKMKRRSKRANGKQL